MSAIRTIGQSNRFICILLFAIWGLGISLVHSAQTQPSLHIAGPTTQSADWTTLSLNEAFAGQIKAVVFESKGVQHTSNCVALLDVLKRAGIPADLKENPNADPKTKNQPLRLIVIVAGHDGYTVTFSMAELLPGIGNGQAWLALDMDGKPLGDGDGPARLLAPHDEKPGRWVRAVATISVIDPAAPTTQPAR